MNFHQYNHPESFFLENGEVLEQLTIAYHTAGTLNKEKNNVVWVCHALTGDSNVFDWWKGLFGENELFNPQDYFIICANVIGSNYGSTNPLSINQKNNEPYFNEFPLVTIKDMARAHELLANYLQINQIQYLIGGSLGGQQALEFTLLNTLKIDHLILLATNAVHSAWGIAFNESQRLAIQADETYYSKTINGGEKGLVTARTIAMLSYRTYDIYNKNQTDDTNVVENFKASSYQQYQGQKLANRFNAYSYVALSKAMDSQNVARNRNEINEVLKTIKAKTIVIGISSDLLFPPSEQKFIAKCIPNSIYYEIESIYGHDGFLVEIDKLNNIFKNIVR